MRSLWAVAACAAAAGAAAPPPPCKDIVALAQSVPDLKTLVTAVVAGDLVTTLQGPGPFTVFAPTNEAFAALPNGTLEKLLKPENKAQLDDILTYHVLAGKVMSTDLSDGMRAKTVEGKTVTVHISGGTVRINRATVTQADVEACNGVVHVIDAVLLPPPEPTASHQCLAKPGLSPDDYGYALSIVCDPAKVDCAPIGADGAGSNTTKYWPNTIYHHCNWAFETYWRTKLMKENVTCDKGTVDKGTMYNCSAACTKCQVKSGTSDEAAQNVISYLCNDPPNIQILGPLCSPIADGGSMAGATVQQKASYVADVFYQGIKCNIPDACAFSGNGEVVSC